MTEEVQIIRVPILPFEMLNAFIVRRGSHVILVDAGTPGCHALFGKALEQEQLAFKDVDLIVVTHAHIDHAGEAATLRELCDAPIVGHKGDLPHYQGKTLTLCPTGLFGKLLLRTGLPKKPYRQFTPDILLAGDESLSLAEYGLDGEITSTPGHTEGTISVTLASREALVGDLVSSGLWLGGLCMKGRAKRPPYEDDPSRVALELQKLLDRGIEQFHVGHGRVLPAREVARHARSLLAA